MPQHSTKLDALARFALTHATESVVASGGPLVPFNVLEHPDTGRSLTRHMGEVLEQGLAAAFEQAERDTVAVWAAVAWDGYLTIDGDRTDAVFVAAHERGRPEALLLAQRYGFTRTLRGRRAVAIGPQVDAGTHGPILTA